MGYLKGLLSPCERKNGWQLAEWLGDPTPDGIQYLLERGRWDPDAARDELQRWVAGHLGAEDGIFIVDETGFIKKGQHSAGVQRQYSGTAGRIENSQVGVFLCYAGPGGSAFLDRELYLPKAWTEDRERCRKAGIPDAAGFASKPELARRMLARALDNGMPGGWVTGNSVYGNNRSLRLWLEQRALPFVLAVPRHEPLWRQSLDCQRADALPPEARKRLSAGPGSKGERWYDWAVTELVRLQLTEEEERWGYYLLIRRHCGKPDDRAFYVVFAPRARATPAMLVRVAGQRWHIQQGWLSDCERRMRPGPV